MLKTNLCGIELKNPSILASGILGMNADILKDVAGNGAGAVTIKSTGLEPREGHHNPKVLVWEQGMANCYGLTNQGINDMDEEWENLKDINAPVIASIFGANVEEFVKLGEYMADKKPAMIELNLSCPNTKEHGMAFGVKKEACFDVVKAVKRISGNIPVSAKLTPQALNIGEIAKACEDAGADAITAINTVGPGMFINIDIAKPVLSFKTGGLSGPAIRPIAVRCVYDIYKAVKIPIIGMGGITYGKDAIEIMMAGATAVGIGTATYYRGKDVFKKVCDEIEKWLEKSDYSSLKEIIGVAHE